MKAEMRLMKRESLMKELKIVNNRSWWILSKHPTTSAVMKWSMLGQLNIVKKHVRVSIYLLGGGAFRKPCEHSRNIGWNRRVKTFDIASMIMRSRGWGIVIGLSSPGLNGLGTNSLYIGKKWKDEVLRASSIWVSWLLSSWYSSNLFCSLWIRYKSFTSVITRGDTLTNLLEDLVK